MSLRGSIAFLVSANHSFYAILHQTDLPIEEETQL